jgi:hypothetical protein
MRPVRVNKSKRLERMDPMANVGEMSNMNRSLVGQPAGKDYLEDLGVN